jgi:hypothetical protein
MHFSKKVSRKDFFKYGAILLGAPLIATVTSSCSKIVETGDVEVHSKLDKAIAEVPSYILSKPLNKVAGENVYKIPISSVVFGSKKVTIVTRIVHTNNSYKLQSVCVKLINRDDAFAYITGLDHGDVLLLEPGKTFKALAKMDRAGLRNRFLPIKRS